MTGAWLQYLLVGLLLAWSLLRMLRQLFPGTVRDVRNRLAQTATRRGWSRLGGRLQSGQSGAGCGSGCDSCGSCSTTSATPTEDAQQPVRLRGDIVRSAH